MKYKQITYQKNFHTSLEDRYLMETIVLVADIEEWENELEVSEKMNKDLWEIHKKNNPHLYKQKVEVPIEVPYENKPSTPLTPSEKKQLQIKNTIKDISTVTDLKVLESYKLIAKNNPELQEAYNNKEKQLKTTNTNE